MFSNIYIWLRRGFTLLELLVVIVIIGIIFTTVNYINYSQIDDIKQATKADGFVSNYNQILLSCMTNNCGGQTRKISDSDGKIIYPSRQNTKLTKTDGLTLENGNNLTLKFDKYTCDSQDTSNISIKLKNMNDRGLPKCFEIDKKCKLYAIKCL